MKIRLHKKSGRNQIICCRPDGTTDISDIGPNLPFHDIAHYIVESELGLKNGFYGNISQGYSVAQLSDKKIIKTLPVESTVAEIVTRALQSLHTGACDPVQFYELINSECSVWNIRYPLSLDNEQLNKMLTKYRGHIEKWNELGEGEYLELNWAK